MGPERIQSKQELSDLVAIKYRMYRKIFEAEHSDHISKQYLQDFMKVLLVIQRFANIEENDDNDSERREEGLADVS